MKIVFQREAIERRNSDICVVTEYPIDDPMIDFATVKINGRYPEVKQATNLLCREIVYIHSGSGTVTVNGINHMINAGDTILIEAGEKFIWEGDLHMFISCRPAFTMEQHQIVE